MMKRDVPGEPVSGCLIYDSRCRLCVAVKHKLERTGRCGVIQFVPYDSRRARECLGERYQAGRRPPMAYWVDGKGTVYGGPEAFLPLLPGLMAGKIFLFFWRFRAGRWLLGALYRLVATYRYRWFGSVESSGV